MALIGTGSRAHRDRRARAPSRRRTGRPRRGFPWSNASGSDADRDPPPKYFGDYPDGPYWSAEGRKSAGDGRDEDFTICGEVIRFFWDYGVRVPLWDDSGLLSEDPVWLRAALGLSDLLVRDLASWGDDMEALDANPPLRTDQAYRELDERARTLVDRLRQEVGTRFTISYEPW